MSAITATEARKSLFGLIQQVNDDHTAVDYRMDKSLPFLEKEFSRRAVLSGWDARVAAARGSVRLGRPRRGGARPGGGGDRA